MKRLSWSLVLPLAIISMAIFTKWWYVLPDDAPDTFMAGFPLPFVADGWFTSMSVQIFILEFIVDFLVYFLFWFLVIFAINRYKKKIKIHRVLTGVLLGVATLLCIPAILIASYFEHVYELRRDWEMKIVATGYKPMWRKSDRTQELLDMAFPKSDTTNNLTSNKSDREILIEELKKIRATLASNDKEQIVNVFGFPVDMSSFEIYTEDSMYDAQVKLNNNKVSTRIFLEHYSEIKPAIWIDEINELFKNIDLDSLKYKDTLDYAAYKPAEPCYSVFQVETDKSEIRLRISGRSNRNYKSKKPSEDEIPENDSSICEHDLWWTFEFDGKKLHFKLISGAG